MSYTIITSVKRTLPALLCTVILTSFLTSCNRNGDENAITASGTIEATDVNISAKTPGQILSLRVNEGTPVKEGDTIATIDHANLDLQLQEAQAGVDQARSQLKLLEVGARSEDIAQTQAALAQAEANRTNAADELRRAEELFKSESSTKEQLQGAQTRFTVADAQVKAATEALQKVKRITRPEDIQTAQARVDQVEATRDQIQKFINDSYIVSPINGIVTHKLAQEGELAGQGSGIVTVTDISQVYLMIYVSEEELPRVKLNELAKVQVDGMPNKTFTGRVAYISPEAEFTPKDVQTKDDRVKLVFAVKINIDNPQGILKRGLPADATLQ